ncbi:MAG: ABC transporter permease [Spirochaetota bacterium]
MRIRNVALVAGKEFSVGPRGMMFVFVLVMPFLITAIVRLVFGGIASPTPRLGVVDEGRSVFIELAAEAGTLEVTRYPAGDRLREAVAANDEDAGLVLQEGFDEMVRAGDRPELHLSVSSRAEEADRSIVAVEVIDIVRSIAGQPSPLEVDVVTVGEGPSVPLEERFVPLLVLVAVAFAGVFLPGSAIVQEREAGTLRALLVTPTTVGEVLAGKGVVGFVLAFGVGALTLLVNGGFTGANASLLVVLAVAALMCVELGLVVGAAVPTMTALFSVWKSGGLILFAPAILFLFPGVPDWIAMVFPTYYFMGPLYEMVVSGANLADGLLELAVAVAICGVLVPPAALLARRMANRLART